MVLKHISKEAIIITKHNHNMWTTHIFIGSEDDKPIHEKTNTATIRIAKRSYELVINNMTATIGMPMFEVNIILKTSLVL